MKKREWFADVSDAALVLVLVLFALMALAGCATAPAPVAVATPVEVRIPMPVPCLDASDLPQRPEKPAAAELRRLPDYELVLAIEQQRRRLLEYEARVSAVLAACARTR